MSQKFFKIIAKSLLISFFFSDPVFAAGIDLTGAGATFHVTGVASCANSYDTDSSSYITNDACTRTFKDDNQELIFDSGSRVNLAGALDILKPIVLPEYIGGVLQNKHTLGEVKIPSPSAIGVIVAKDVTGAKITFDSGGGGGIDSSNTNKTGPSIANELGGTIKTLELKSGAINSTDTAVFLRDSDSGGTDIFVRDGAFIQGARNAIRYDNFTCINQDPDDNKKAPCISAEDYNRFTGATKAEAEANAEAGIIGRLTLRVVNEGIIASNPRLISQPTDLVSSAFYSTGNSRIKANLTITNETTGKIYGGMTFGDRNIPREDIIAGDSYIKSEVLITNKGLISSHKIFSDYTTKLTLINEAGATIRIEDSPIAGSDGVTEIAPTTTDIFKVYEGYNFEGEPEPLYIKDYDSKSDTADTVPEPSVSIRPQGDNSVITNYGTIIGNINSSGKTHTINLNGGTITGNVVLAGTLNFSNDFSSSAMIGNLRTRNDRVDLTATARINIGTKTYNISSGGTSSEGTPLDGSLTMTSGTGGNPIISTTFTNDGAIGRLNFDGVTTINSGIRLNIGIGENYSYLKSGVDYLVIDGDYKNTGVTTSDVVKVDDANISINDGTMGVNRVGVLTIHSAARDLISSTGKYKDLVVYIERLSADEVTDDETAKKVYEVIGEIGSDATGKLKEFQKFVDTNSDLKSTSNALKSAAPTNDGDIELATMVPVHKSLESANNRMNLFISQLERAEDVESNEFNDKMFAKARDARSRGDGFANCNSGDADEDEEASFKITNPLYKDKASACNANVEEYRKYRASLTSAEKDLTEAAWAQAFGSLANRSYSNAVGYNSNTYGFAIGRDTKTEKNALLGASISYANTNITYDDSLRNIKVDTIQANVYGGKLYKSNYFWDAVAGIAWNQYSSTRQVPSVAVTATASYSGQNYIGKLRGGYVYKVMKNRSLNFIPEISATFVRRNVGGYTETGADTMSLKVRGISDNYLEGRVGYNVTYDHMLKKTHLKYRFHNSYAYNFTNKRVETTSNFVGQSQTFTTKSQADGSASIRLGLGLDANRTENTIVSLDYMADLMNKFIAHSGSIKLTYRF